MDVLEKGLYILTYPLRYPLLAEQRIYWLYLAWALALAGAVYLARRDRAGRGGLLGFWFPKRIYAHASAVVDYKFFLVNRLVFPVFLAPFVVGSAAVSGWTTGVLDAIAGAHDGALAPSAAGTVLLTVTAIVAFDGAVFIAHYLQHKVPLLWEFHKVHHSAEVLTPITVYRMHPVDDLLTGTMAALLTGMIYGAFSYLYADGIGPVTVVKLNIFLFAFYLFGYNLRHSHVWLSYPRTLSHVLISPAQHQIHHSLDPKHFDKNIGFIFAFWDALAGTLYVPRRYERLDYGLYGAEHREFDGVWRLYTLPFRKAAALLRTGRRERA